MDMAGCNENVKVWGYNLQCSKDISSVTPCLSIHHHIISNSQSYHGFTWLSTGCVYLLLRIWMRSRCVTSHLYEVYRRVSVCVLLLCMRYIGGCWQPHTRAFDTGGGPEERGRWSSLFSLFKSNNDDCELPFPCSKAIMMIVNCLFLVQKQ